MKVTLNRIRKSLLLVFTLQLITCFCVQPCFADDCSHPSATWKADMDSMDIVGGFVWERYYCDVCGAVIKSQLKSFSMHDGSKFLFTPNEFDQRFNKINKLITDDDTGENFTTILTTLEDNDELYLILCDESGELVGFMQFSDESSLFTAADQDEANISCVLVYFSTEGASTWVDVMLPAIITCDSSLEVSDAADVVRSMIASVADGNPYTKNGISYAFSSIGDYHLFVISLLNN